MTQHEVEKNINSYIKGKRIVFNDWELVRMVARHYYYFCRKYFARRVRTALERSLAVYQHEPDPENKAYWDGKCTAYREVIHTLMSDL